MKQQKILQMTLRKHNNELQLVIQSIPFMDFALFKSVPCLFYSHKKLTTSIYGKGEKMKRILNLFASELSNSKVSSSH